MTLNGFGAYVRSCCLPSWEPNTEACYMLASSQTGTWFLVVRRKRDAAWREDLKPATRQTGARALPLARELSSKLAARCLTRWWLRCSGLWLLLRAVTTVTGKKMGGVL